MQSYTCIKPSLYQALTILPIALLTVSIIPKLFKFFSPKKFKPGSGGQFPYNDFYTKMPQNFLDSTNNTFSEESSTTLTPINCGVNDVNFERPILDLDQIEMDNLNDFGRDCRQKFRAKILNPNASAEENQALLDQVEFSWTSKLISEKHLYKPEIFLHNMRVIRIYCRKDFNSTTDFSFDPVAFDFLVLFNNFCWFGMFFFGLCLFMSKKLSLEAKCCY